MRTAEIRFKIPETILLSLNQSNKEFTEQLRLVTALQLFKSHKLTFGQAVELAGMTRDAFLVELDKQEIPLIDYDPSELEEELKSFET